VKRSYAATPAQQRVLRCVPKREDCLRWGEPPGTRLVPGVIVFFWLADGRGLWYLVRGVTDRTLSGWALADGRWRERLLDVRRLRRYY